MLQIEIENKKLLPLYLDDYKAIILCGTDDLKYSTGWDVDRGVVVVHEGQHHYGEISPIAHSGYLVGHGQYFRPAWHKDGLSF